MIKRIQVTKMHGAGNDYILLYYYDAKICLFALCFA